MPAVFWGADHVMAKLCHAIRIALGLACVSQAPLSQFVTILKVVNTDPSWKCWTNENYEDRDKNITKLCMTCGFQAFKFTQCTVHYLLTLSLSSFWLRLIGKVPCLPLNSKLQTAKTPKVPSTIPVTSLDRLISSGPFCHSDFYCKQFCRCFKIINQNKNWKQDWSPKKLTSSLQQFAEVFSEIIVSAIPSRPIISGCFAGCRDLMTLEKIVVTFGRSVPQYNDLTQSQNKNFVPLSWFSLEGIFPNSCYVIFL